MALPPGSEIVVNGVTARVRIDGYRKGNSIGGGPWRDVKYLVSWDESDTFMDGLLGIMSYSGGFGGSVTWPVPHAYPGNGNIYCTECSGDTVGPVQPDETKLVRSTDCEVSAHYAALPWDVEAKQPEMSFDGEPRAWARDNVRGYFQAYKVPAGTLQTKPGSVQVQRPSSIRVPHLELRRTIFGLPYLMVQPLLPLIGKINAGTFWGFSRGTVLMEPWDTETLLQLDGSRMSELHLTLTWRPYDWNYELNPEGTLDWVEIEDPDGNQPYEYANFDIINLIGETI